LWCLMSITDIQFLRLFTKAFLWGIYLVSFFVCLRWLVLSDDGMSLRKRFNRPMLIITIILFVFSSIDFALCMYSTVFQGAYIWLSDITGFLEVLTCIIIDSVMILRCWLIYNKSWRIAAFPLLLLLYNVSCLPLLTYWSCGSTTPKTESDCSDIRVAFFTSSVMLTIYATAAIIWKILKHSISLRRFHFVIRVIVESGSLYTLTSIATFFVLFRRDREPFHMVAAIGFPIACIAYNLILIRVAQNRVEPEDHIPSFIDGSAIEHSDQPGWKRVIHLVVPRREAVV